MGATVHWPVAFHFHGRKAVEGVLVKILPVLVSSGLMLTVFPVLAQQLALAPGRSDCAGAEPDPVEISWNAPCQQGDWLFEPGVGCRMWDWHPDKHDKVTWSGACRSSLKEGNGVSQWTEHGLPIDRFEGTYRNGRREGAGRYVWNATDRFEGTYANDLPNGFGTVTLAGTTLSGEWRNGCLKTGDKVVAIGVPRASCEHEPEYTAETATLPN